MMLTEPSKSTSVNGVSGALNRDLSEAQVKLLLLGEGAYGSPFEQARLGAKLHHQLLAPGRTDNFASALLIHKILLDNPLKVLNHRLDRVG